MFKCIKCLCVFVIIVVGLFLLFLGGFIVLNLLGLWWVWVVVGVLLLMLDVGGLGTVLVLVGLVVLGWRWVGGR